jgi:hypothetical protein
MPKTPGNHTANYKATLDVQGLITGATYKENEKLIVLCGYSKLVQPFIYLLYDYDNTDFFNGNKRKINLGINLHQVEAIATKNGLTYYVTNEELNRTQPTTIHVPAKLHKFDLSFYLKNYLVKSNTPTDTTIIESVVIGPVPTENNLNVKVSNTLIGEQLYIFDALGKMIFSNVVSSETFNINTSLYPNGLYIMMIGEHKKKFIKL